jgi:hypothetical protein
VKPRIWESSTFKQNGTASELTRRGCLKLIDTRRKVAVTLTRNNAGVLCAELQE